MFTSNTSLLRLKTPPNILKVKLIIAWIFNISNFSSSFSSDFHMTLKTRSLNLLPWERQKCNKLIITHTWKIWKSFLILNDAETLKKAKIAQTHGNNKIQYRPSSQKTLDTLRKCLRKRLTSHKYSTQNNEKHDSPPPPPTQTKQHTQIAAISSTNWIMNTVSDNLTS